MNDRYLITGATGFIGSCLVRELVSQQKNVFVIVRNKKLNWRIVDLKEKINIFSIDLLDKDLEKIVFKINPTYIFHLAAYGAVPAESGDELLIDVNLKATINLVKAAKNTGFKLFINSGSSSEYGIKNKAMSESDLANPINTYGISKLASTLYCQKEGIINSLPIITLRLFSPYGPYEMKDRLIPYVITHALKKKKMQLSSSKNVRDFIFINDVVSAYMMATRKTFIPGEIFNIGSGNQHSVEQVVDNVLRITNVKADIQWDKVKREVQVEPAVWKASIAKVKRRIGWEPKYSLEKGLKSSIAWFENNLNLYKY